MMRAAAALVGLTARSVTQVEDEVSLAQLRVLVLVASRGPLNLGSLARAMGVHPSNASRACDRLVASGLLTRSESAEDRRHLVLELTDEGRKLIVTVTEVRRTDLIRLLERLPTKQRPAVVAAMQAFADAAGESSTENAWRLGWPSGPETSPETPA